MPKPCSLGFSLVPSSQRGQYSYPNQGYSRSKTDYNNRYRHQAYNSLIVTIITGRAVEGNRTAKAVKIPRIVILHSRNGQISNVWSNPPEN